MTFEISSTPDKSSMGSMPGDVLGFGATWGADATSSRAGRSSCSSKQMSCATDDGLRGRGTGKTGPKVDKAAVVAAMSIVKRVPMVIVSSVRAARGSS